MDNITLQYVEITFAASALFFGLYERYKRIKTEKILKTITQTYPGDVAKIEQSCTWAWTNVRDSHTQGLRVTESPEKHEVLRLLNLATGDTAASARMCHLLFNQLLGFQEAQFGTRIIKHPEKRELDLCKAEARIASAILNENKILWGFNFFKRRIVMVLDKSDQV